MNEPADSCSRHRGYYLIAHRAGNNLHQIDEAVSAGVDAIECDFWHDHGRLAVRHERKLPALPVLYDRWHLRWSWGELSLPHMLRELNFRAELFLDIKSSTAEAAASVLAIRADLGSMMPRTLVSSKEWALLDRLAAADTDMRMFYSVVRAGTVVPLLRRAERTPIPAGTSIRHTLLSEPLVKQLHDAGIEVYAWTVNTKRRADELRSWGVDGIISDDYSELSAGG